MILIDRSINRSVGLSVAYRAIKLGLLSFIPGDGDFSEFVGSGDSAPQHGRGGQLDADGNGAETLFPHGRQHLPPHRDAGGKEVRWKTPSLRRVR